MRNPIFPLVAALALVAGCRASEPADSKKSAKNIDLQGAGATFPYPLYSKWVAEYERMHPEVRINYQSIGSGGGIRQITERIVDFGASDAPMTDAELAKAPAPLVHVPTTLGAVVVAFHLPGVTELKLSPDAIAGIFLGEIAAWNDARIAETNPGRALPDTPITVAYRSDGSGTTAVFTEYLAQVSPAWKEKVGAGKSVRFPAGLGAKGNEGVAGQVRTTPGAVGYVELAYAKQTKIPYASVKNRAGVFAEATPEGVSAAAASVAGDMPEDLRVSIVDAPGETAYPISAFTYVLVYAEQKDRTKGEALARFLWWATHDGQKFGPALDYAPLPQAVISRVEQKLRGLSSGGQPLLTTP